MIKKVFMIVLLMSCLITLTDCYEENLDGLTLEEYIEYHQTKIDKHMGRKKETNYNTQQWKAMLATVESGKTAIMSAVSVEEVDEIYRKTILNIDLAIYETAAPEMVDCRSFYYSSLNSSMGDPIVLTSDIEDVVFYLDLDIGVIINKKNTELTEVESGVAFWWLRMSASVNRAYIDVTIQKDDLIVGYVVLEIYPVDSEGTSHRAKSLASALFPNVDGAPQNITLDQLKKIFDEAKVGHKYD